MEAKTPVPGERNGNGRRNAWGIGSVLAIAGAAIVVLMWFGVPSPADVQTKTAAKEVQSAAKEITDKLKADVEDHGRRIGSLETATAVQAESINQLKKTNERLADVVDAVYKNQATMMTEVAIPPSRIARPKER